MPTEPIVTIVVPTFNRHARLARCLDKITQNVTHPHEIIVVDGGSTDRTRPWLQHVAREVVTHADDAALRAPAPATDPRPTEDDDPAPAPDDPHHDRPYPTLRAIFEPHRQGAVKAFNRGFRAARGRYVMWLNDDAYPLPGAVDAAVAMIERPDLTDVGMIAFYHNWHTPHNVLDRVTHDGTTFELCHVRGYPYANFGLLPRSLLARVGYADERFYFFGFDPDLSLKIQITESLAVIGCRDALIAHDEHHDRRKREDLRAGADDNRKLFEKWKLPDTGTYPDPAPAYRRMLIERGLINARPRATTPPRHAESSR
ncbi:MAG: glycosyltransferase family 2 protein [Phycisphaerae bacterium]